MNEHEQFLKDLGNDQNRGVDILDAPLVPETEQVTGATGVTGTTGQATDDEAIGDDLKPKNRRERRLMRKLQSERESSIFLAGKLEAREEAKRSVTEESDYLKAVERIYGTETPEAQLATDLLKKAIVGSREDAKREAIAEMKAERQRELDELRKAEDELDGFIDEIEDTYGVTLNETQEKSFFQLLQKMSPKDRDGKVINFADPHAVWEVFQDKLKSKGTDNRAKVLSNRSMTQSGASKESTLQDDTSARFLRENGII